MHTIATLSSIDDPGDFSFAFRNFLDDFYAAPRVEALSERPASANRTRNAYLAATADYLCNRYDLAKPAWLWDGDDESLIADPPYFASENWKTRAWLLADSPQEFRQRNIFIGFDSLSRT